MEHLVISGILEDRRGRREDLMLNIPVIKILKDTKHRLHLELLAGKKGLGKKITIPRIQKPGLALTGDTKNLHPGRIQIIGKTEMRYLNSLR